VRDPVDCFSHGSVQRGRQIMPHSVDQHKLGVRNRGGRILATGGWDERIIRPVNNERWYPNGRQP
jgi:hypothetical protein